MIYVIIAAAAVVLLFGLYLFLIKPNLGRREMMKTYEKQYIAHRGLYDNATDAPENSLNAFRKAVENGYGIELDVQLTTDGKLVVFHDGSLKRMCGADKMLWKCCFDELEKLKLAQSEERIPLFSDVLAVVGGKVPLIVEVKSEGDCVKTAMAAAELLDKYDGTYCVESFAPSAVKWYRKNRPDVIRGQLSMDYFRSGSPLPWIAKLALSDLWLNCVSRPDFIAYDHSQADRLSYRICRKIFPVENVCWTVKNQEQLDKAKKIFDVYIFDSFIPDSDN